MTSKEKSAKEFWEKILNRKGSLTDEEAEEMHRFVRKLRNESKF